MIHAGFNDTDTILHLRGLTQWDYGQKLKITGLKVPNDHIQIHFTKYGDKEALIQMGKVGACGDILVDIPNQLLKDKRRLIAYIYLDTGTEGETIREIQIDIKERAKPYDYKAPDEKNLLEQLYVEVKTKADGILINGDMLQLTAGEKLIGSAIELPTAGIGTLSPEEINGLF